MTPLEELLNAALANRDNFSEEIPKDIIRGALRFKVQKNWLNLVTTLYLNAEDEGLIGKEVTVKYEQLVNYLTETNIWSRNSTVEDIKRGNEFLNSIIDYCRQKI
jgi:hypothetical protein